MKTLSSAILVILLTCAAIATAETSKAGPKLRYKPQSLALMKLPGVDVVTSESFTHFIILDAQKIDFELLKGKALACQAGQGCGAAMTSAAVQSFYAGLEAAPWEHEVLADRLVGAVEANQLRIFGRAADQVLLADNLRAARFRCYPGNAEPQCPPQPPVPKDVWLGVLGVVVNR